MYKVVIIMRDGENFYEEFETSYAAMDHARDFMTDGYVRGNLIDGMSFYPLHRIDRVYAVKVEDVPQQGE